MNEELEELKDCYYSKTQLTLMNALGCPYEVSLNGEPVSHIHKHGTEYTLLKDEVFVGTAKLKDITCIEKNNNMIDGLPMEDK